MRITRWFGIAALVTATACAASNSMGPTGGQTGTGTGKGKKSGVAVVFAVGVIESAPKQFAGAAFIVDKDLEEQYKEAVLDICQTVRRADEFNQKDKAPAAKVDGK